MFDLLFGWRKASKCKKLIRRVQCRLKLLKNKRFAIATQLREDIAELLKNGYEQIAFNRLEQLYLDECLMTLYELLDQFSEFIVLNLSYIRRHKDIPNDINEAVSTLIYASARCGDLPELRVIRELFGERYGRRFANVALELHSGNLVNQQVKDKLSPQTVVPEDVKNRLLDEIVRDFFFKPGPLALKYTPEFHLLQSLGMASGFNQEQGKFTEVKETLTSPRCSVMVQSSPSVDKTPKTPDIKSLVRASPPRDVRGEEEKTIAGFSSEGSIQCPEKSVIYLDDVEEFKSPCKQGEHCIDQDQRFFVFKARAIRKVDRPKELEGRKEMGVIGSSFFDDGKSSDRKRARRRSVSREKHAINDVPCEIYYGPRPTYHRKHRKKIELDEGERVYPLDKGGNRHNSSERKGGERRGTECFASEYVVFRGEIEEMGSASPISSAPRGSDAKATVSPSRSKCWVPPPYMRAATMPHRRKPEAVGREEVLRSNSLPVEKASPRHVHPKLPDYDEIAAKFLELKKFHQKNNKC